MVEFIRQYDKNTVWEGKSVYSFPRITKEEKTQILAKMKNYLFRSKEKNIVSYICTNCDKQTVDNERTYHPGLVCAKHNEYVYCPNCNCYEQLKDVNKCGSFKKINSEAENEERIALIRVKNKDEVYVENFYAERFYGKDYLRPSVRLYPNTVFKLTPTGAENWIFNYQTKTYKKDSRLREPFYYAEMWSSSYHDYSIVGFSKLGQTFLKYILPVLPRSCHHSMNPNDLQRPFAYLQNYCKYPIIEMLLKTGREDIVNELVFQNKPSKTLYNWNAKGMKDFIKPELLTSEDRRYLMQHSVDTEDLKILIWLRKKGANIRFADLSCFTSYNAMYYLKKIGKCKIKINKFVKYIKKNKDKTELCYQSILSFYWDYLQNLREATGNKELTDIEMFPPNLRAAHDRAVSAANIARQMKRIKEQEELIKKAEKSQKRRKKEYEYEADGFRIILPKTPAEIILEGHNMHHCVGGYAERHFQDKLTILFLRRSDAPDEPLATIEMHGASLVQIQGKRDTQVWKQTEGAEAFFKEWLKVVKKRFAAKAQRKTKKSNKNAAA